MVPLDDVAKVLVALREQARARADAVPSEELPTDFPKRYNSLVAAISSQVELEVPQLSVLSTPIADFLGAVDYALTTISIANPQGEHAELEASESSATSASVGKPTPEGKPRVFVGCSTEGIRYAKIIQMQLEHTTRTVVWHQGVFGLSTGTLETLVAEKSNYDYAILVLTPDDVLLKRDESGHVARDNVIFELGLFMGSLGRENVFMVAQKGVGLPSDLAGVTVAAFEPPDRDENLVAALGPVITKLELAMHIL